MKMPRRIWLLLALLLCLAGCRGAPPDPLAFRASAFRATLRGNLRGMEFSAEISVGRSDAMREISVTYLEPPILSGVRIRAQCDADAVLHGEATLTLEELTVTQDAVTLQGLLAPLTGLLALGEIQSLQRTADAYVVSFGGETTLAVSHSGVPTHFSAPDLSFVISDWQEMP